MKYYKCQDYSDTIAKNAAGALTNNKLIYTPMKRVYLK